MRKDQYSFTVTIPGDFSTRVASMAGPNPKQAKLVLAANESANYISSQISSQLAGQVAAGISQQITTEFIDETITVIEKFRQALVKAAADTSGLAADTRKLAGAINEAAVGTARLADGAEQVADANAKIQTASVDLRELSSGASQVAQANAAIAAGVSDLADYSGDLTRGAQALNTALTKASTAVPPRTPKQIEQLATVAAAPVASTQRISTRFKPTERPCSPTSLG